MSALLHEYWENDDGAEFSPVRDRTDQLRPTLMPNARRVFAVVASSWHEAMQLHNERLGYGDYSPVEGIEDHIYTDEEAVEQEAYLRKRSVA